MSSFPILLLMIAMPLLGALVCSWVSSLNRENASWIAIFISVLNSIFAASLWFYFDEYNAGFQFVEEYNWLPRNKIQFSFGVDGISLFFIVLSVWLSTLVMIVTRHSIKERIREYNICCLFLQSLMVGSFASTNLLIFFIFFEGVLIPMFFIIGIWGGENKIYASIKFFLYTLFGSVFLLIAIAKIYTEVGSLEFADLFEYRMPLQSQIILWLAFFLSFGVKTPMWPLHTWLPDAHVEAPTGGSVILAGILLKMGGYGFIRFSLKMFPDACKLFSPYVLILSVIAIIWASLIALSQKDIKKLIAYSSIAHMGIVTFGIFTLRNDGLEGAILQMISHGLVSGALFFCVGILYDRFHTRNLDVYGGIYKIMPFFSVTFLIFSFSSIGLPFTSGFIGEILILITGFKVSKILTALACVSMVLGAAYMLNLLKKLLFGEISNYLELDARVSVKGYISVFALKPCEKFTIAILCLGVIAMGVYPKPLMTPIRITINKLYSKQSAFAGEAFLEKVAQDD